MADQNIVIDIETRTDTAMQRIAAMGQLFRSQTAAMSKSMQGIQSQIQALGKGFGFNMPDTFDQADALGEFDQRAKGVNKRMNNLAAQGMIAAEAVEVTGQRGKQAGNSMMEAFDGAAMGLMFFGMQVQRIFTGIMRSGISTFQDVHSQLENTTTATDRLSGAWQFLKFNIGEALQPVMEWLLPIVDTVAKFIEENKTLVRWVTILGAAFGTLAMTLGAVQLGWLALKSAFTAGGFLSGFASLLSGPVAGAIAAIAGVIYTVTEAWNESSFFRSSIKENIITPIQKAFEGLIGDTDTLSTVLDYLLGITFTLGQVLIAFGSGALTTIIEIVSAAVDAFTALFQAIGAAIQKMQQYIAVAAGNEKGAKRFKQQANALWQGAKQDGKEAIRNVAQIGTQWSKAGDQMALAYKTATKGGLAFSDQLEYLKEMDKTAGSMADEFGRVKDAGESASKRMSVAPNISKLPDGVNLTTSQRQMMSYKPEPSRVNYNRKIYEEQKKQTRELAEVKQNTKQNMSVPPSERQSSSENIMSTANRYS